ncbi:hypothetical protein [Mesorhizobium erdmanii]|uniref:hypothetical protein n=1 Tax=Mesorhizobium erdmanii TaxID=1777866 RepID=UPI0003FE1762|nr:hypothetical protein [Mesorhizobium erdmanii]
MAKGLYRHSETVVMVLYEKNSMLLPKSEYEQRGYQPILAELPTHAEWVEWHRVHGHEMMTQSDWEAWLKGRT